MTAYVRQPVYLFFHSDVAGTKVLIIEDYVAANALFAVDEWSEVARSALLAIAVVELF